jgi:hypothetical protein
MFGDLMTNLCFGYITHRARKCNSYLKRKRLEMLSGETEGTECPRRKTGDYFAHP